MRYTWIYRCFIIYKCPSHAINPVDTITLLNIQTCLHTFIVYFDYAATILEKHCNIMFFCNTQWYEKNTEMSTRLIELGINHSRIIGVMFVGDCMCIENIFERLSFYGNKYAKCIWLLVLLYFSWVILLLENKLNLWPSNIRAALV